MYAFRLLGSIVVTLVTASVLAQETAPRVDPADGEKKVAPPPKAGAIITQVSSDQEKVADEAGQIYVTRGYKGVVPGVRDESAVPAKMGTKDDTGPAMVEWVGFQPFTTYSRVFIQVSGKYSFSVTKPKGGRIEVRLPNAGVSTSTDLWELVTRWFPTAVDRITVTPPAGKETATVVSIYLKKAVGYLYRQEGKYLFVDVEL
jgi:hypothetical protein